MTFQSSSSPNAPPIPASNGFRVVDTASSQGAPLSPSNFGGLETNGDLVAPLPFLPTSRLYLAVDCGGTKAAAAISDQNGRLLARGFGGPANFTDVGLAKFLEAVSAAIKQALLVVICSQGELPHPTPLFEAAWFGIAGVDSASDVHQLSPFLASLLSLPQPSKRLLVANDTSLLAAPVRDPEYPSIRSGVVVIAGTGSIVMSFKEEEDGTLTTLNRVGGFGWLLGDEGSGFWVGRDALRYVLDQADRERSSSRTDNSSELGRHLLRDRILEQWHLSSTDELLNAVYSNRPLASSSKASTTQSLQERKHRLASLAPLVFHLAFKHGDPCSLSILQGQARGLASQVAAILRTEPGWDSHLEASSSVLCMGGSLLGVERYRELLTEELRLQGIVFHRCVFVGDPAKSGAIALARLWEGGEKR
ncbi:hypothetical protein IE53DRAFT_320088 [Violaceomyces palustris]|uniref:Uncharacterized protein n=1 Tax=Violaceomyces palustris TaxID=1673888 RepID=A0ACD0NQE4_9BASI|nr:hypothetical protein IE53DRAFT_320088 [Violaceomyces palustris]